MDDQLRIRTLGGLKLERSGQPVAGLASRKAEALLVYLAADPRPHRREHLAELLWDDKSQSRALANLRGALSCIRQAAGQPAESTPAPGAPRSWLQTGRDTAALDPEAGVWLDTVELENGLSAEPWDPEAAGRAVALYQGEFLAGFSIREAAGFAEWQARERARLRALTVQALQRLVEHHLARDEREQGLTFARRLVALAPLSETAHRQLIELLALSGQHEQALAQYERLRQMLRDEFQAEPAAETAALFQRTLSGDLDRPFRLGSYEIREKIGEGGMANVYRAYQPAVDRDVAIKVIRETLDKDLEAVARFQREARLIARLEHPHILPIYDFYSGHGPPFIVMRLVEGMNLRTRLQQGLPDPGELLTLLGQIGSGLDYAHRHGIVHRDIKPSNILIDRDGNSFLADFGIAYMLADPEITGRNGGAGAFLGTPNYMAPEQIQGGEITRLVDVYSLGVIIFEMLTGVLPFASDNPGLVLSMHLQAPVPSASERNPALSPEIDAVIARAMAKDPGRRFPTVTALVEALSRALAGRASPAGAAAGAAKRAAAPVWPPRAPTADLPTIRLPEEQKRIVTAVYVTAADFVTVLEELTGSEAARGGLDGVWRLADSVIMAWGGTIVTRAGDTILALWGVESSREDDAERAIRAALALRHGFQEQSRALLGGSAAESPQLLSIGISTGMVLLSHAGYRAGFDLSGATISLANRLAQQGQGLIVIAHDTYSQVRGVFNVQPIGQLRSGSARIAVPMYQVLEAKPRAFRMRTQGIEGLETMMIGREAELAILTNAFQDMVEDAEAQFFTIVGEAGIGKSRLLYEFTNWCELSPTFFWLLHGRATAEMTDQPYALLRDLLSLRFEILDTDSPESVVRKLEQGIAEQVGPDEEMAHLLGYFAGYELPDSRHIDAWRAEPAELVNRAKELYHQWLVKLCALNPVVIELEDIHQADEASLALLSDFVSAHPNLPLLIVGLARPSLYRRHPAWDSGLPNHTRIDLRPLDKRSSRSLVREILQKVDSVPNRLRDLLVDQAEGIPYYLEELVKMLIEDRVIIKDSDEVWRVEGERVGRLPIPTTLTGLLQARIDSLLFPEKLALERAAVIGRIFVEDAVISLGRVDEYPLENLGPLLDDLVKREYLFRRETAGGPGSREFMFTSKMVQDMLLETLTQSRKAAYSEAAAHWLIDTSGDRAAERGALIARYFHQAGRTLDAADWYVQAAEHAILHGALTESRHAFDRALALIPPQERLRRWRALAGRNEVLGHLGDTQARLADDAAMLELAGELGDDARLAEAHLRQGYSAVMVGDYHQALAALDEAHIYARRCADLNIEARLLSLKVNSQVRLGLLDAAAVSTEEALAKAEALGDEVVLAHTLNNVSVYYIAIGDLAKAAMMCQRQVTICRQTGHRTGQIKALLNLGYYYLLLGLYDQGRQALEQSLALSKLVGSRHSMAYTQLNLSLAHIHLSNCRHALELLGQAEAVLKTVGDAFGQAASYFYGGLALEACGDYPRARQQFARAAAEMESLGMVGNAIDARAGSARCAQAQGLPEAALDEARGLWDHLARNGGQSLEFPILAYLSCAQIFEANGHDRPARQAAEKGYLELQDQAERISDEEWRQSFLANVPAHRALLALWAGDRS